jgi:putative nucleotidyltransferase with HDIG domain
MVEKESAEQTTRSGALQNVLRTYATPILAVVGFLIIYLIVALPYLTRKSSFKVGRPSPSTVTAMHSFEVEDLEKTNDLRESERQRVKDLYLDPSAQAEAITRLHDFFVMVTAWNLEGDSKEELRSKVREAFGLELSEAQIQSITGLTDEVRRLVTSDAVEIIASLEQDPISTENLDLKREEALRDAGEESLDDQYKELTGVLAAGFLKANTAYPLSLIYREMEKGAQMIQPAYIQVSEGEKILDKGDIVTILDMRKLEESGVFSTVTSLQQMLGIFLIFAGLTAALYVYLGRKRSSRRIPDRIQLFYPVVLVIFTVIARGLAIMAESNVLWGFLIPVPLVALLTVLMLGKETALVMTCLATVITGFLLKGNFYLTIAALLSGLVTVFFARRANRREDVLIQGIWISAAVGLSCFTVAMVFKDVYTSLGAMGIGVVNGLFSTVLALGLIPLLEKVSGATTHIRLLELASPESPLMKDLITTAPGTYSHSLMLGNLAEAAAREVGADPLLARVGAYYHDIGKIKRPTFFVENLARDGRGHENINPNLSALIISAHVKEGVELAQQYHLPQEVIDIIQQHHGTSVIKYFYARAIESMGKEGKVEEEHFRYPGEKPHSKEAAIVMLADALEAATRSLPRATPVKLEQVIQNVIEERLRDGQLDECELSLQDLGRINRAFLQMTLGSYHERVQYPSLSIGGNKWKY